MGQTQSHIPDRKDRSSSTEVVFAITGTTAVGKSTFINSIRNVSKYHPEFARQGFGDTTLIPTSYKHPNKNDIVFWDLPGFATLNITKDDYTKQMNLMNYDFIFIFFEHVITENGLWIAEELVDLKIPFCFVRTKIDIDIQNAETDGRDPNIVLQEIRQTADETISSHEKLRQSKGLFLISSYDKNMGDMSDLIHLIETYLHT